MRVVVASDAQAGLTGWRASEVIAAAFDEAGAAVAVLPLATGGDELAAAVAAAAPKAQFIQASGSDELVAALTNSAGVRVLDLTAAKAVEAIELLSLPRILENPSLVALVPEDQAGLPLTGLDGVAASRGREVGADLADVLACDARLADWAAQLGVRDAPGAGALAGLGALVLAAGGRVVDPLTFLAERFGLAETLRRADLAVTGAEVLDFHQVGGPVVQRVVAMAGEALCPAVAIVAENYISSRELRLAGIESAHQYQTGLGESDASQLAAAAARVAASWTVS